MKKLFLTFLLITIGFSFEQATAQVKVSATVNVDIQPDWGPRGYYHVNYYYLPDIDVYYYVPQHRFIYLDGGKWIFAASLPEKCRSYDLYGGYKVIINEPKAYLRHKEYHRKFAKYKGCYNYQPPNHGRHEMKDDDGPGNGRGRHEQKADKGPGRGQGHAYGHDKHPKKGA